MNLDSNVTVGAQGSDAISGSQRGVGPIGYDSVVTSVPTHLMDRARLILAHAAIQRVADSVGAEILHVKGYATDPSLSWVGRVSTDVDVLVHPDHVERVIDALVHAGWQRYHGFETGSPFEHAYTAVHEIWGYLDVHRHFPGLTVDRKLAFERLWADHFEVGFGGVACAVPSADAQRLIVVLHAARLMDRERAGLDVAAAWTAASAERQAMVRGLVDELGAEVAFAAAVGGFDAYRDRPDYLLWRVQSRGGTRVEEWWGRIRVAPRLRDKARLVFRALLVNVEHLSVVLGHQPTRREVVREFVERPLRGIQEELRRWQRLRAGQR